MTDTPIADSLEQDAPSAPVLDVTHLLNLPADPPEAQRTYTPGLTLDANGVPQINLAPVQPAPVVSTDGAATLAAPSVSVDASGVPHVTIPLTKKTKGYVGTAISVATSAALVVVPFLPADSQLAGWIAVGVGIVGNAAVWLGITLPTNLPVKLGSKK